MDQSITVTFVPEQIITWLIIGLIAGFLAGVLVRGRRLSLLASIVIGLVGSLIGGILAAALGVQVPPALQGGLTIRYFDVLVSFIGALLVLVLVSAVLWRRG